MSGLVAAELPVTAHDIDRLGTMTVDWVAHYVAKQEDLTSAQRLLLGRFLLDHGPARVGDMKRLASYSKELIRWASERHIQQITGLSLLNPDVLPRFLAHAHVQYELPSYNECKRLLVKLAKEIYPLGDYSDAPRGAGRPPAPALDETTYQLQCDTAKRIRDANLRCTIEAILLLPRGCGASGNDLKKATGADIFLVGDHLFMRRAGPGEPLPVLQRFRDAIWYLKARAGRGPLLTVGVEGTNITGNLGRSLDRAGWDPDVPKPSLASLLSAYKTELALRGVPLLRVRSLVGNVTLRSFDSLVKGLPVDLADPRADVHGVAELPIEFFAPRV